MGDVPVLSSPHGLSLPAIGLGTYKLKGAAGVEAIGAGLRAGYRLLDSAANYDNEGAVGRAVRHSAVPREEIVVTSKLPGRHHRHADALAAVEESVYRSGLEYLDLYLIHWPNPRTDRYVEAWQALVEARDRGLVRAIGVCNFLPEHLDRLTAETGVTPAVNQIELHPYFPQNEQRAYDADHGILTQSWSPLARARDLFDEPVLTGIAKNLGVTVAQLVLRWHLQLGAIPLPKATSPERQAANLDVFGFELSDEEMARIASLARPEGRLADQDPAHYEEF
ncbi:aldo/keto reductase [Streptomyces bohaiensis]|uniref:Aldo/keto reductase n=1 Tax=Streptomyces bohaiensis TaxID=1431344 RepID=A0ABX1CEC4_9ACTN|nr:aldo/keto reductase [Streptomyces bohaiensis]NJQ17444.1 aldo/keto reductase [Streptomyces bohaiensis]